MTITMPRGDIRPIHFNIYDSEGACCPIEFDEIYFTVKRSYSDTAFLFQKRLYTGTIWRCDDHGYEFIIEAADTDNLKIGKYVCDIELLYGTELKQTTVGELVLTNEVTFASNEG